MIVEELGGNENRNNIVLSNTSNINSNTVILNINKNNLYYISL